MANDQAIVLDDFTIEHLRAWLEFECYPFTRDDEEFKECERLMIAKVEEDPEFWLNQGWPKVYDAIQ